MNKLTSGEVERRKKLEKLFEKSFKNLLTNRTRCSIIEKSPRAELEAIKNIRSLKIEQQRERNTELKSKCRSRTIL